ncbi:MAG TPA: hypothetical protein VEQ58_01280, partial [Polyangiaceae bacterium]|nr:hypothetical protein [Polyangiaceae bacterium]
VGCCGVCDGANVTAHDFIAYNRAYEKQVKTCGEVACEPCPDSLGEETVKYFLPNCVAGQCVVEDLRTSDLTACELDSDCRARAGNGCCPGCGSKDLLGVRSDQSFEDFVCAEPMPCPQCAPPPWKAVCGALGHCIVPVTAD